MTCSHVPEAGWAGTKNGALLRAATGKVDIFITIDSNLAYQQSLEALPFAVIILVARTNRLSDLLPLLSILEERILLPEPALLHARRDFRVTEALKELQDSL